MSVDSLITLFKAKNLNLTKVNEVKDLYKVQNSYLLGKNKNIIGISLKNIEFSDISKTILSLTSLSFLRLVNVNFTNLTSIDFLAKDLETLSLSRNELEEFPIEILEIKSLNSLSMSGNQITKLPKEIQKLINLQTLGLSGNKFFYLKIMINISMLSRC